MVDQIKHFKGHDITSMDAQQLQLHKEHFLMRSKDGADTILLEDITHLTGDIDVYEVLVTYLLIDLDVNFGLQSFQKRILRSNLNVQIIFGSFNITDRMI